MAGDEGRAAVGVDGEGREGEGRGAGEGQIAGNAPYSLNGCSLDRGEELLGVREVGMIDESGDGDGSEVVL